MEAVVCDECGAIHGAGNKNRLCPKAIDYSPELEARLARQWPEVNADSELVNEPVIGKLLDMDQVAKLCCDIAYRNGFRLMYKLELNKALRIIEQQEKAIELWQRSNTANSRLFGDTQSDLEQALDLLTRCFELNDWLQYDNFEQNKLGMDLETFLHLHSRR